MAKKAFGEDDPKLENERNAVIRKNMREIRKKSGKTQKEVARGLLMDRTVYSKYETGKLTPNMDFILRFSNYFSIPPDSLEKSVSAVIPDTSALLKNRRLLSLLLHDFDVVIIPDIVLGKLDRQKEFGRNKKAAWQVMMTIDDYRTRYSDRIIIAGSEGRRSGRNDDAMIDFARTMDKKLNKKVYLIHDDIGMTLNYDNGILLKDYIAKRTSYTDYESLLSLDEEYNSLDRYQTLIGALDLNAYLPDGMTLLISCIRCNDRVKVDERGGYISDTKRHRKLKFLLSNGANPDKTDNSRYCLTPLSHCVQTGDFKAFCILLNHGADYNKGSVDEVTPGYLKMQNANEGNTPLMIACWHGRKRFVEKLCQLPNISLNQQDSNGYTALHKCAVQRYNRRKEQKDAAVSEDIYRYLLTIPRVDTLIRDRNNKTAEDWWNDGDALGKEGTAGD